MLTIQYPQLAPFIESLSIGLWTLHLRHEADARLIIKTTKEMLLTAKVNRGFKIYVIPVELSGQSSFGLISAFFDNEDEPLVIFTPIFDEEESLVLLKMLQRKTLDIHLFDELSRELLGYTSDLKCPLVATQRMEDLALCPFELELAKSAHTQMKQWFGLRTADEDLDAIVIEFQESHFADDLVILDARPERHLYPGGSSFSHSQLEREEPGPFQERDIAQLLGRLFDASDIILNPCRVTDKEEISDLLLVTDADVLIVQAKDSPNTEKILRNTITRKKKTAEKSLFKAISQVRGALRHIGSMSPLMMLVGDKLVELDIGTRRIRALIVVRELFDDEYGAYSPPIIELSRDTGIPCIALDYPELQAYTRLSSSEKFFEAFDRVYTCSQEVGQLPRLRIWVLPDDEDS